MDIDTTITIIYTVHIVFILKKMSNTIQNYFLKRKLEETDDYNDTHVDVNDEPMSLNTGRLNPLYGSSKESVVDDLIIKSEDFVSYMNRTLTDNEKLFVFKNIWHPPRNYAFPLLDRNKSRGLKCQFQWLNQ